MKIPETLKVGGNVYKVIDWDFKESVDLLGQADNTVLEIRLCKNVKNPLKKEEVFLHEMLHAINYVNLSSILEEKIINKLSQGLYQVLKDNGLLK